MKTLSLEQGSAEWLSARKDHLCASDCSAMMGASKYKSRNQLLQEKKTGKTEEVTPFKQELFDRGHATEASARNILETENLEDYLPKVGTLEVEGLSLLASLDGMSEDGSTLFEHKLWNETLAANVSNEVLEPHYYWQLEQQLLVTGANCVIFVVSDGTESNWIEMVYGSDPDRRKKLIAGWKQFGKDLETYEVEAKQEAVVGHAADEFPVIKYEVAGSIIKSNIAEALPLIKERAEREMSRTLETDQDFADKENLNKATVKARAMLKEVVERAKGEFVSFSEFSATAAEIDSVLQKMQSQGEKQVKDAKAAKKLAIQTAGEKTIGDYLDECNKKISPLILSRVTHILMPDFAGAMKGKRNLESLKSAVDGVVAQQKIEVDQVMARVMANQIFLREHAKDYAFLFNDVSQIINQETEPFQAIVKQRISDHNEAEQVSLDAIQKEADRKATIKAENKVKGDALIAFWEETAEKCNSSDDTEEVRALVGSIKGSNCDEAIFGDGFSKALVIYDYCHSTAVDRLTMLTAVVHEVKVEEPAPDEVVEPEVVEPEELAAEETPSTFVTDLAAWAKEYSIPQRAVNALGEIMRNHGV